MASIVETTTPATEPLDLATAKHFLRLPSDPTPDDDMIQNVIIPGARRQLESEIGVTLANRNFIQYEDGFPFFPYFQSPYAPLFGAAFPFYFGYGPIASYPYPAIGGLQNQLVSPFEKRLLRSPVTAIDHIDYIGTDGKSHGLLPGKDFVADFASLPGRLTPQPGQRWPVGILGINTVSIFFSAGYMPPNSAAEDILDGAIWQALTNVAQNSYVIDPNGNVEQQISTKGRTGKTEPTWPTLLGSTVSDGNVGGLPGVVWKNLGPLIGAWQAGHVYTAPAVISDGKNLQNLIVTNLTSGGSAPTWATAFGAITTDNSQAAWMNIGLDETQNATDPANQITEYQSQTSIPPNLYMAILQLVVHWYQNRDPVVLTAGAGGKHEPLPMHVQAIVDSERVWDFGMGK